MPIVRKQAFSVRISPDDRYEDLLDRARVELEPQPQFGGQDVLARHFRLEALRAPRVVQVTLAVLVVPGAPKINDLQAMDLLAEEKLEPISPHAFIALLGQHPQAGCMATGLTLPQPVLMNGYAGVLRFMYRKEGKRQRTLGYFPVRSTPKPGFSSRFGEYELFAGEPVRNEVAASSVEDC